jgi:hypothetical protein
MKSNSLRRSSALLIEANYAKNGFEPYPPAALGFVKSNEKAFFWSLKVKSALIVPISMTPNEILSNFKLC